MPRPPSEGPLPQQNMRRRWRVGLTIVLFFMVVLISLLLVRSRPSVVVNAVPPHSYAEAFEQAHNGKPGAARVLYQQLARDDLSDIRRASLLAELPNYPSPQALKLVSADLQTGSPLVKAAAIESVSGLVTHDQRSLLIGPLLDDPEQSVQFAAARALLGLSPDDLGLYFTPLQQIVDKYETVLKDQPPTGASQLQLARLYLHNDDQQRAYDALSLAQTLEPHNLEAGLAQIDLLDTQGKADQSRQLLAQLLERRPESSLLQHTLGMWLLHHGQGEYALLALTKAVELEPENSAYRYDLAIALHDLDQLEAAQKQLEEILQHQPSNRSARVLLIRYWKENGQLQKVQVLLAELEQQNPDDPALQQGL